SIARDGIVELVGVSELIPADWEFAHPRRVVARFGQGTIAAYEAGGRQPIWSVESAIRSNAKSFWNDEEVTVASAEAIIHVDADGKLAWQINVDKLTSEEPGPAIVDSDGWLRATRNTVVQLPVASGAINEKDLIEQQQMAMLQQRRVMRRGGQVVVMNGNVIVGGNHNGFAVNADQSPSGQPEQFNDAILSDQTVFASTTSGRVAGIDLKTGQVKWTRRVSDRAPTRLVSTGAVVGLIVTDSSSSRLVMLDPTDGSVVHTRAFGGGNANKFTNLGTDRAGLLVGVTASQMLGFDTLLDPRKEMFETPVQSMNAMDMSLDQTSHPNQIAFSRDRFAVVIDGDSESQRVGLYESNSGEAVTNLDLATNRKIQVTLPIGPHNNTTSPATLRRVGDRLYVWTTNSLASYSLSNPSSTPWSRRIANDDPSVISYTSLPIARDLVVAITYRPGKGSPTLETFSRAVVKGNVESGQILDMVNVEVPVGPTGGWQAVDGGLYAKTTNGRLVFLPGATK
ncbi:MAG TPA: PQQ-binding-like beta-propeller repeat protein, partial [Tepidisphaeraceae bacterium]|nr:PQQ-binding-like beta-propeller repeat protein [Tepidisphaeraceae bacterium]